MEQALIQLQRLVKEAKVPLVVLAELCDCSAASIKNYISGASLPNGSRIKAIEEGLKRYKETINRIID